MLLPNLFNLTEISKLGCSKISCPKSQPSRPGILEVVGKYRASKAPSDLVNFVPAVSLNHSKAISMFPLHRVASTLTDK